MTKRERGQSAKEESDLQTYRHHLDTMLLLVHYPPFQVDVAQLRTEFDIPEQGFTTLTQPTKEENVYENTWYRQLREKTEREGNSPEFHQKLHDLRVCLEEEQVAYDEYQEKLQALNDSLLLNQWRLAVRRLLKKYRLPSFFERHVQAYILTNIISAPAQNFSLSEKIAFRDRSDKQGEHELSVEIHHKLTRAESREIPRLVNADPYTPKPINKTRLRPRTAIERDLKIMHESSEKGVDEKILSDRDIAEKIWTEHLAPRGSEKLLGIIKQARLRIRRAQKQIFDSG